MEQRNAIIVRSYASPLGQLLLGSYQGSICLCDWQYRKARPSVDTRIQTLLKAEYTTGNSSLLDECIAQLQAYFRAELESFDLPLLPVGSAFQQSVWAALCEIPYGKTETYLGLSQRLNQTDAIRAVASANGANALSIIIPCHRVLGSDGSLTGYAGGLQAKRKLLALEGVWKQPELF